MDGPTLAMPTVLDTKPAFPRSHSSPDIPDLATFDSCKSANRPNTDLPRSASFTSIPHLDENLQCDAPDKAPPRVSATNIILDDTTQVKEDGNNNAGDSGARSSQEERPKLERIGRRKSLVARPKSWIQRVKGSPDRQGPSQPIIASPCDADPIPPVPKITKAQGEKAKTVAESFATFARKSWISTSRSPSPSRKRAREADLDGRSSSTERTPSKRAPAGRSVLSTSKAPTAESTETSSKPSLRRTSPMFRIRPQSVLVHSSISETSSTSSLPRSSMDERSTPRTSTDRVAPIQMTPLKEKEKLQIPTFETPKRRDELWSAFRNLDTDYGKFQAKTWSLKTNVVRATLLPFLRTHVQHPSNSNLRPEDLDRRVNILNKWWAGLLEVLEGRQNQTVSGIDRPVLLEAVTAIMTRPEWRAAPAQFAPLSERASPDQMPRPKSSVSLNSSSSQFLIESVHHNVRNLFVQNLLTQMNFAVDKMSLRHAPASLVTFCGKAAAYAFFFVPAIAEMLVRIWRLKTEDIRRVADEFGLSKRPNKRHMDEVIAKFPDHIHSLGWSSVNVVARELRQLPVLPVLASKIAWFGPWVARWCGRDSDLFYVFVKHYHILAEEFMPSELSLSSKARAPGFVLVQTQVLAALDATIHRQPTAEPLPITFEDVLSGADASAATLPLPSNNSSRLMTENRLVTLLRDFISERSSDLETARMTFAEAFAKIIQAGARRTSLFDHNACFVLCDFLEEVLTLFIKFHQANDDATNLIDWTFWLHVCKKMLDSQNSMSDIRLFAFIFTTWSVITNDESRKKTLCMDWLLSEEAFSTFFNHWCPMVRAYYMRLLCWRICRDSEEHTDLDTKILTIVLTRLRSVWANYLFLRNQAEETYNLMPSTAPCLPAPGRRLLIIRNDTQSPSPNLFLGFDGLMSSPSAPSTSTFERHSSLSDLAKLDTSTSMTSPEMPAVPNKKRWTFISKVLPVAFTSATESPNSSPSSNSSKSPSPTKTLEDVRRDTAISRSRPNHSKTPSSDSDTPPNTSAHKVFSFKFSLEWNQTAQNNSSPNSNNNTARNNPYTYERRLYPPRLPAPAHAWLGSRVPGLSNEVAPRDPSLDGPDAAKRAKYAGRALAEWSLVVVECNNFVERRRAEGVPGLRHVEIPTLSVEGFRRFG